MASPSRHDATRLPSFSATPGFIAPAAEGLIVLTQDREFLETLRAVTGRQVIAVSAEPDLAIHLLSAQGGVAVIDADTAATPIAELTERVKTQFPELVLVVAGGGEDQSALTAHIGNGTVYRFLHKPLSPQRVKLFIDAAWRRHGEGLSAMTGLTATRPAPAIKPPRSFKGLWVIGAVLAASAAAAFWMLQEKPARTIVAQAPVVAKKPPTSTPTPATGAITRDEKPAPVVSESEPAPAPASAPDAVPESAPAPVAVATPAREPTPVPHVAETDERQRQLIERLIGEARKALAADHIEEGERWTEAAREAGADERDVDALNREADRMRLATRAERLAAEASAPSVKAENIAAVEQQVLAAQKAAAASQPSAPVKVHHVDPEFPNEARQRGANGWVDVELTVLPDGSVGNTAVLGAEPQDLFDKAALAAVRKWRYEPFNDDPSAEPRKTKVRIRFELQ